MAIQADDFRSNSLTGSFVLTQDTFTLALPTNKFVLEGNKTFRVYLRKDNASGPVIDISPLITITDTSSIVTLTSNVAVIEEGDSVKFDLTTSDIADGTYLFYDTVGNVNYNDFVGGNTGIVAVSGNTASFTLIANTDAQPTVEGDETFQIRIRGSQNAEEQTIGANVILVRDTSNVVSIDSISSTSESIFESQRVIFSLTTLNALGTNSKTIYYSISGNADITTSTTGTLSITNNSADLPIVAESSITGTESKSYNVVFRRNNAGGPIIGTSNTITVNNLLPSDTTTLGAVSRVISVTPDKTLLAPNSNVTFTVTTVGGQASETLFYETVGNVTLNNFIEPNATSVVMTSNVGTFNLTADGELPGSFRVNIKRSQTGAILLTSDIISAPQATGGNVEIVNTTVTHAFTSPGTFLLREPVIAKALLVGGGGGGAPSHPAPFASWPGGGGGAGGLVDVSTPFIVLNNSYPVTVGSGGTIYNTGGNTEALGFIALGGGGARAGSSGPAGLPGGSGGGAGWVTGVLNGVATGGDGVQSTSTAIPADSRTYGYGFPGGSGRDNNGSNGGGGGAGQAGGNYNSSYGGAGRPVSWVPSNYGTTGPAPGRWFAGGGASVGSGGAGGGGNAAPVGVPGVAATGGGGGAGQGSGFRPGAPGGSGIFIVQYDTAESSQIGSENISVSSITANSLLRYDQTARLTVTTTGAQAKDFVYWTLTGNVDPNIHLVSGQATSGFMQLNSNVGYIDVTANSSTYGFFSNAFTVGLGLSRTSGGEFFASNNNVTSFKLYDGLGLSVSSTGTVASSTSGSYTYLTFTGPGTFSVSDLNTSSPANFIEYLVVAGGGGGGDTDASGGGAGGFIASNVTAKLGNYNVVIGAGGAAAPGDRARGNKGGNTYITHPDFPDAQWYCEGGGGGAATWQVSAFNGKGGEGGSGGGAGPYGAGAATGVGGGFPGGNRGGGGASEIGNPSNGWGGYGKTWLDGIYYSDGGGSGFWGGTSNRQNTQGGSGRGGPGRNQGPSGSAQVNSGSGGGGGGEIFGNGGNGGSGIVKIRYLTP